MKLNELDTKSDLKVLVYGESGSGKTCFAAGFPGPIWVADFDNKISSAAMFFKGTPQVDQITYESYAPGVGLPAERFNNELEKLKQLASKGDFPYKTIVLDSLTIYTDEAMKYLIKANPGIKRTVTKGAQLPVLQDFGVARLFFKQTIMELLSLPCNVIVTAHIQIERDEFSGQLLRSPMMPGKLARELPIYFGEVYRSYVQDGKYLAQTQSDSQYSCRTQLGLKSPVELKYNNIVSS